MACSTLPGGVLYSSGRGGGRGACLRRRTTPAINRQLVVVKAVAAPEDCNEEDCAPEKEVGKVSMEWKAAESTQVLGTYPPLSKKKWTGYVEKDTAGQTNIYAVEPTVYVSENVISSNTAGDSSEGSEQTLIVAAGLGLGLLLGACLVLQSVRSTSAPPPISDAATLSYYIHKFTPLPTPSAEPPELQPSPSDESLAQPASDIPVEQPLVPVIGDSEE